MYKMCRWFCCALLCRGYLISYFCIGMINQPTLFKAALVHDDVIKWKNFPRWWPFVRGIHRSRWFETPSRSLWRHCNGRQCYLLSTPGIRNFVMKWHYSSCYKVIILLFIWCLLQMYQISLIVSLNNRKYNCNDCIMNVEFRAYAVI